MPSTVTDVSEGSNPPLAFDVAILIGTPSAMRANALPASSLPAAFSRAAVMIVDCKGEGNAARPACSTKATAATSGMPMPPCSSGTQTAVQPSSTTCCHRSWSQTHSFSRCGSELAATIACSLSAGRLSLKNLNAESRNMASSSPKPKFLGCSTVIILLLLSFRQA